MRCVELETRTKHFAVRIIRMFAQLPRTVEAEVIGRQVTRSGTSVAANYREAGRARSRAEMVSKLGLVEQELDETLLWLELLVESGITTRERMAGLIQETDELIRIMVASISTLKGKKAARSHPTTEA